MTDGQVQCQIRVVIWLGCKSWDFKRGPAHPSQNPIQCYWQRSSHCALKARDCYSVSSLNACSPSWIPRLYKKFYIKMEDTAWEKSSTSLGIQETSFHETVMAMVLQSFQLNCGPTKWDKLLRDNTGTQWHINGIENSDLLLRTEASRKSELAHLLCCSAPHKPSPLIRRCWCGAVHVQLWTVECRIISACIF